MGPLWQLAAKVALTAFIVVAISEVGRRSSFWAAVLASLPLTSVLAFVWMHVEGAADERVASLSQSIFWLVLPSLPLFVALPLMLRAGWGFWPSLLLACAAAAGTYGLMLAILRRLDVAL
jgi:hypothetical protein